MMNQLFQERVKIAKWIANEVIPILECFLMKKDEKKFVVKEPTS